MQTWGVKFYQKMLMLSLELTSSSYSLDLMNSNTRAVLSCCVTGSHALWWQQNRFNHICGWTIVTYTSLELSACITRKLCWVISAQDLISWEFFFQPTELLPFAKLMQNASLTRGVCSQSMSLFECPIWSACLGAWWLTFVFEEVFTCDAWSW